ncbi:unnamed protein product [Victoria cruziana]
MTAYKGHQQHPLGVIPKHFAVVGLVFPRANPPDSGRIKGTPIKRRKMERKKEKKKKTVVSKKFLPDFFG